MSHGMRIVDGAGVVLLDTEQTTLLRFVHEEALPGNFSGTFDVPDFDDTRGFFVPLWRPVKAVHPSGPVLADGADWAGNVHSRLVPYRQGTLSWNHPTMTISFSPLPNGFVQVDGMMPSYRIRFYHYK